MRIFSETFKLSLSLSNQFSASLEIFSGEQFSRIYSQNKIVLKAATVIETYHCMYTQMIIRVYTQFRSWSPRKIILNKVRQLSKIGHLILCDGLYGCLFDLTWLAWRRGPKFVNVSFSNSIAFVAMSSELQSTKRQM